MRINYLSTLAAASVLSLGFVVGCANPCAAQTKDQTTETQGNPCASKSDSNPCASKTDANPCASKSNANPCAGQ
ncbi:hypothetical protein [Phormidium sp. CCY1219]|uniref:hypothetical protein n=1 Tax=Phormidium sp. CCY1219 TaxID=2886104 RepID=UPI002D1E964D|nr:hypothetical protein [Phormidium sp. CCY1219]MEB3827431.1 hypothetical protein [Phormidium sp. CCY1219]